MWQEQKGDTIARGIAECITAFLTSESSVDVFCDQLLTDVRPHGIHLFIELKENVNVNKNQSKCESNSTYDIKKKLALRQDLPDYNW